MVTSSRAQGRRQMARLDTAFLRSPVEKTAQSSTQGRARQRSDERGGNWPGHDRHNGCKDARDHKDSPGFLEERPTGRWRTGAKAADASDGGNQEREFACVIGSAAQVVNQVNPTEQYEARHQRPHAHRLFQLFCQITLRQDSGSGSLLFISAAVENKIGFPPRP